jgi:hypothetical protein
MSATRTFSVLKSSTVIDGDTFDGAAAEKVRQAMDMSMYFGIQADLGGDERPILSASYVAVNGARTFDLNADTLGGLTLEAVVWYYTTNAATSVRVRVRNTSDSSNAAEGTLSTATTVTREVLTLTMASGIKTYQLQVTGGNADNGVYAWGMLRLRKVAA